MIRTATSEDTPAILNLAVATGMFLVDQVAPIEHILNDIHRGSAGPDHHVAVKVDDSNIPIGVVYFSQDTMAERKWDLWMIAVKPDRQRQGMGRDLILYTQEHVKSNNGRLIFIDTSSQTKYLPTHAFYRSLGYREVARIADFYADNDDKIIFSKHLNQRVKQY